MAKMEQFIVPTRFVKTSDMLKVRKPFMFQEMKCNSSSKSRPIWSVVAAILDNAH